MSETGTELPGTIAAPWGVRERSHKGPKPGLTLMVDAALGDAPVGTGETHTVREFVEIAFPVVGLNWRDYVVVDPAFVRPVV